jgi:CheY-like chemotaxis protein
MIWEIHKPDQSEAEKTWIKRGIANRKSGGKMRFDPNQQIFSDRTIHRDPDEYDVRALNHDFTRKEVRLMLNAAPTNNMNIMESIHKLDNYNNIEETGTANPKRVLVVDDDNALREMLDQLLTVSKFKVKSVDNGREALDLFMNELFELVLTDVQMPGMDGWELTANIKKISPETPVILMTGMHKNQIEKMLEKVHADSVLYKPFDLRQFETLMNRYFPDRVNSNL